MTLLTVIVITNAMKSKCANPFRFVTRATSQISECSVAQEIWRVRVASNTGRLSRCVPVLAACGKMPLIRRNGDRG